MNAGLRELLLQRTDELLSEFLAVLLCCLELVCDGPELLRVGVLEAYVAHLVIDVVQSKLMSQRHIEHHGLEQLLLPGALGEDGERAHHFESVGYLQHYGPRVGRVLDYQLLVVLGFESGVLGLYGRNPVQGLHQIPQILGKRADIHIFMHSRRFVQIHCCTAFVSKAHLVTYDLRDIVRVGYETLAVVPCLILEGFQSHAPGFFHYTVHTTLLRISEVSIMRKEQK